MTDTPPFEATTEAARALSTQMTAPPRDPSSSTDHPSLLAGRYKLNKLIGEGGMGQVFDAEHVLMKKRVAIKILRGELTENPEMIARFQREAQAAAALKSPFVCQATDFGQTDDGALFLVMEHLEGQTLQENLDLFGHLSPARALHILTQIITALQEAHEMGIIHRDLKPENIMLIDQNGDADTVKIMDFGIARIEADSNITGDEAPAKLTRQGMIFGTPHYMSPEQVSGDAIDHRTDLYSTGVVLFEMLTGSPPFDGDNIARIMGQHVTAPVPALSTFHADLTLPGPLEELVYTLLKKDKNQRPQSASEVLTLIERAQAPLNKEPKTPSSNDALSPRINLQQGLRALENSPQLVGPALSKASHLAQKTNNAAFTAVDRGIASVLTGAEHGWRHWSRLQKTHQLIAVVGLLFLGALLSATVLLALLNTGDRQAQQLETQQTSLLDDPQVQEALHASENGDREALTALLEEDPDNPHLQFLALKSDLSARRNVEVLTEVEEILALDSRYANDPELVSLIVDRFYSGNTSTRETAENLLRTHMGFGVRQALSEEARTASRSSRRDRAFTFLEDENQLRHFPAWEQSALELRQTSGCDELKAKIQEVLRHREPAALSTLEAMADTPRRGCGTLRLRDCIGCVREDLRDAIETLSEY